MSFRFHPWATFFSLIGLLILLSLGTWQLTSYLDATDFEQRRDARIDEPLSTVDAPGELAGGDYDFRRVELTGSFDPDRLYLIKHRVYDGHPGFWVVRPMYLTDRDGPAVTALPVNLGWVSIEEGVERAQQILENHTDEPTSVSGLLHVVDDVVADSDFRDGLDDQAPPTGIVELETYDITAIDRAQPEPTFDRPLVLTRSSDDDADDDHGPVASFDHITDPYLTAETHFGYMLTWYLLAVALIAIWIAHGLGILTSRAYEDTTPRS